MESGTADSPFTDVAFFTKHRFSEYVFIFCACCGQLLMQSATTDALTHMYQLKDDFNDPEPMVPWYIASFGLAVGTVILISGRVGDAYGIRNALMGGYAWTMVWSILCGISYYDRSDGAALYICCRTFQGVGVAFILPNVLGAVGRIYKPGTIRKRLVFGLIGFNAPLGGFLGIFMSGVIAVRTKYWYWNYYAFAIFSFIAAILTYFSVPELPPRLTDKGERQDLDLIGGFLGISGLTLFNFAWNQAPVVGWDSAYIITLLVVSVPLLVAFVVWECNFAKHPLVPAQVLSNWRLTSTLLVFTLGWGAFGVNIYHYATLMQEFRHESPFVTGAGVAPAPVMGLIAAISCSLIISPKTDTLILFGSMLMFAAASIILATAGIHESYFRHTLALWLCAPFGMDWSFPAVTIIFSEELPPHLQGLAGSLVSVTMNYGISIFLGIAGTVEQQLLDHRPDDKWRAWRGALYFNIGVAGLATAIAFLLVLQKFVFKSRSNPSEDTESSNENLTEKHPGTKNTSNLSSSDSVSTLSISSQIAS
nr:Atr1 [Starmerella bombicola]